MKNKYLIITVALTALTFTGCESQRSTSAADTPATASAVETTSEAAMSTDYEAGREELPPSIDGEMPRRTADTEVDPFVSDADFVAKAAEMGMAEVKFSKLAEKMAVAPAVKDFAVEMQEEHTRANSLLMQLAKENKWKTPEEMNALHQEVYYDLMKVMSDKFDRRYMEQMVKDHEMAIAMYQQASGKVTNPQLREFIIRTTPALQDHLNMARKVLPTLNTNK